MIFNIQNANEKIKNALKEFDQFSFNESGIKTSFECGSDYICFEKGQLTITYSSLSRLIYSLFLFDNFNYTGENGYKFENFVVMLDLSRNAVKTVKTLKEFMRYLVLTGYSGIQLYIEDLYEIPEEPYFGYKRGRYSKNELKEIVSYAKQIGLECVPAIQTLAHLNAITRWRTFKPIIDCNDILLADEEQTYNLIENMFKSLSECFNCKKINIGMDEAHMVGLGKYLDKHGYTDRASIIVKHLEKVCEIAKKYGFTMPMMWNDMFIRLANQGDYDGNREVPKEILDLIPKNVTLIGWNYDSNDSNVYASMIKKQQKFKRKVYFAGGVNSWHGVTPQNKYGLERTKHALKGCKKTNLKNFILTIWGDDGAECSPFACLPTICYAGCVANGKNNYKAIFKKLVGIEFNKFLYLDLANDVAELFDPLAQPSKYMLYNDCLQGIMDCCVTRGDGQKYVGVSKKLSRYSKDKKWGYLFETQKRLSDLLLIKYELGVKTREIYASGDKNALNKLVNNEYKTLIKRIDLFYNVLKQQWFIENKPYGFEVQDYRLGGLKQRVIHCRQTLKDYLSGKIDKIEELEEPVLSVICNDKANGKGIDFRPFSQIFTANIY